MEKITFALYFGNRGFFPGELIADARKDMAAACRKNGYGYIAMDESLTRYGAVETISEGETYAKFLKENEGKYNGIIVCLPNFGDENGAYYALKDASVPILIQAYPDEIGKRNLGLLMYDAPNAVEELKHPRSHPTKKMVFAIKETLAHFEII